MSDKKLEIVAKDKKDEGNLIAMNPRVVALFPGIALFYRSLEQRSQKYGKKELATGNFAFGFDTYIPKIYGDGTFIKEAYNKANNIRSKFYDARNKIDIILYPPQSDLPEAGVNASAKNYKIPWLHIPQNVSSLNIFLKILIPEENKLDWNYLLYKAGTNNPGFETIYFKAVKLDTSKDEYQTCNFVPKYDTATGGYETYDKLTITPASVECPIRRTSAPSLIPKKDGEFLCDITINKAAGFDDNTAIIAYFLSPDNKEKIIGQVNVYKPRNYKFKVHFVNVGIDGEQNIMDISTAGAKAILDGVNTYFKPTGIEFEREGKVEKIQIDSDRFNGTLSKIYVHGKSNAQGQFDIVQKDNKNYLKDNNAKDQSFADQLDELYKNNLADNLKTTEAYKDLIDAKKGHPKVVGKERAIVNYLLNDTIIMYIVNELNGGDLKDLGDKYLFTKAYAIAAHNRAVMYSSGISEHAVFAHELGHTLSLKHTFDAVDKVFPNIVSFSETWNPASPEDKYGDIPCHGGTWDNMMDYQGDNTDFVMRSFINFQWKRMWAKIDFLEKDALVDATPFSDYVMPQDEDDYKARYNDISEKAQSLYDAVNNINIL